MKCIPPFAPTNPGNNFAFHNLATSFPTQGHYLWHPDRQRDKGEDAQLHVLGWLFWVQLRVQRIRSRDAAHDLRNVQNRVSGTVSPDIQSIYWSSLFCCSSLQLKDSVQL
jgi:hypothetical protein